MTKILILIVRSSQFAMKIKSETIMSKPNRLLTMNSSNKKDHKIGAKTRLEAVSFKAKESVKKAKDKKVVGQQGVIIKTKPKLKINKSKHRLVKALKKLSTRKLRLLKR